MQKRQTDMSQREKFIQAIPYLLGTPIVISAAIIAWFSGAEVYFTEQGCQGVTCHIRDFLIAIDRGQAVENWGGGIAAKFYLLKVVTLLHLCAGAFLAILAITILTSKNVPLPIEHVQIREIPPTFAGKQAVDELQMIYFCLAGILCVSIVSLITSSGLRGSSTTSTGPYLIWNLLCGVAVYMTPVVAWAYMRHRMLHLPQ